MNGGKRGIDIGPGGAFVDKAPLPRWMAAILRGPRLLPRAFTRPLTAQLSLISPILQTNAA